MSYLCEVVFGVITVTKSKFYAKISVEEMRMSLSNLIPILRNCAVPKSIPIPLVIMVKNEIKMITFAFNLHVFFFKWLLELLEPNSLINVTVRYFFWP